MHSVAISALWVIAFLTFVINPKNIANRWGSLCIFLTGLNLVLEQFHLYEYKIIFTVLYPYTFLLFSMNYTGLFLTTPNWKRHLIWICLIAPLFLSLLSSVVRPVFFGFPLFPYWILYIVIADSLLIYSYITTKNPEIKKDRLSVSMITLPVTILQLSHTIFVGITNKSIAGFPVYNAFLFALIFLTIFVKYGILGGRLHLERFRLSRAMQAMSSGTSFINHTMKNEILNMSICLANIENIIQISNRGLAEDLQFIRNSTNRMLAIVTKINEHMREISLHETPNRLIEIIDQSLARVNHLLELKNISIAREYHSDVILVCDPVHLQETLVRIFRNAIEAMDTNGNLLIGTDRDNEWIILSVTDTGVGIPKENLAWIFDPFYSTKNNADNLGLGLSYCYQVMQKHGGLINVHSEERKGTTVFLNFSAAKIGTPCGNESYSA